MHFDANLQLLILAEEESIIKKKSSGVDEDEEAADPETSFLVQILLRDSWEVVEPDLYHDKYASNAWSEEEKRLVLCL